MHKPNITQYNPKNPKLPFALYVLCKGNNSGKPLDASCPNCFVISCTTKEECEFYRSLLFCLWKSGAFREHIGGSVIPFLRIRDFKQVLFRYLLMAEANLSSLQKDIQTFVLMEQHESAIRKQLILIAELKRVCIGRHLVSKSVPMD